MQSKNNSILPPEVEERLEEISVYANEQVTGYVIPINEAKSFLASELFKAEARIRKAVEWLANGEHGLSSISLCVSYLGGEQNIVNYPCDPSDFRRCILFIESVGEERPSWMKGKSKKWDVMLESWDELTALWEQEKDLKFAPMLYEKMEEILSWQQQ